MDKQTFDNLTKFTQDIVDSLPRVELEDNWFQFNDQIDVNIWWEEDNAIKATAYPIKTDKRGFLYTDISQEFCEIKHLDQKPYIYERGK